MKIRLQSFCYKKERDRMKIGITYDLREDYGIDRYDKVFADFCHPDEIEYMAEGIRKNGHTPVMIGNMYHLNELLKNGKFDCDLVLVCDEGISSRNREAIVPAILELNKIPYIGSDAYCMGLSQNKYHTKLVAEALGIRCPKGIYMPFEVVDEHFYEKMENAMKKELLQYPLVVKPNEEGYSMGVFLVNNRQELLDAITYNFENYKEGILIEEYIKGKELYAPLIGSGNEAYMLGIGICRYEDGSDIDIFSLEDKCFREIRDEIPELSPEVVETIRTASLSLYRHMGCVDFGRCDYKLTEDNIPVLIEINPRPGLTEGGPYENCARACGKTYEEVLGEIIESARKRYQL